jgi:hypothetical protein
MELNNRGAELEKSGNLRPALALLPEHPHQSCRGTVEIGRLGGGISEMLEALRR